MPAKNNVRIFLFAVLFSCFYLLTSCSPGKAGKLRIAVAANLQFAIEELVTGFSEETGIDCEIIIGSSGKLTAQIVEGAPFDVFMSADLKFPGRVFSDGFALEEPVTYAYGKLVIWSLRNDILPDIHSLTLDEVSHIALGNPKTAPYGMAAMSVIDSLKLDNVVRDKLVFGESISQTNQFITSGAAEIGFTSKAVVMASHMEAIGHWKEVDASLYPRMAQGLVILDRRDEFLESAMRFKEFVLSDKGKEILHKFGYEISE